MILSFKGKGGGKDMQARLSSQMGRQTLPFPQPWGICHLHPFRRLDQLNEYEAIYKLEGRFEGRCPWAGSSRPTRRTENAFCPSSKLEIVSGALFVLSSLSKKTIYLHSYKINLPFNLPALKDRLRRPSY